MPPIHPAVVHFPIALTFASVAADTLAFIEPLQSLSAAGAWMLLGAALGATLAVPAGYFDMKRSSLNEKTHHLVHLHLKVGWAIAVLLWALLGWRFFGTAPGGPSLGYIVLAWLVALLVGFQGWFGGEMVYGHGAGVAAASQGTEQASHAKARSLWIQHLISRN